MLSGSNLVEQVQHDSDVIECCTNISINRRLYALIKDNYRPGKVLEKINTHSYSGFVHYEQNYIISEYESMCCIRNCYICND